LLRELAGGSGAKQIGGEEHAAMQRTISGWFLAVTGFLACPCHLVVTLPLAAALLSGTALGGWITTHQGAIVVGASMYFVGALAAGAMLLLAGTGALAVPTRQQRKGSSDDARTAIGVECCPPASDHGRIPAR
jgi:mercuric ion transport protein